MSGWIVCRLRYLENAVNLHETYLLLCPSPGGSIKIVIKSQKNGPAGRYLGRNYEQAMNTVAQRATILIESVFLNDLAAYQDNLNR